MGRRAGLLMASTVAMALLGSVPTANAGEPPPEDDDVLVLLANGVDFIFDMTLDPDGHPLFLYYEGGNPALDSDNGLRLLRCTNADCSGPQRPVLLAPRTRFNQVEVGPDGRPILALSGDEGTQLIHCSVRDCSGPQRVVDPIPGEHYAGFTLDHEGLPVFWLHDASEWLIRCTDPDCSAVSTAPPLPDGITFLGLALTTTGIPVLTATNDEDDLLLVRCSDPLCAAAPAISVVQGVTDARRGGGVILDDDGIPAILYADSPSFPPDRMPGTILARCSDAACTTATHQRVVDAPDWQWPAWDIVFSPEGKPLILSARISASLRTCSDRGCQATPDVVDLGDGIDTAHLELGADGLPAMAVRTTGGRIRYISCRGSGCEPTDGSGAEMETDTDGDSTLDHVDNCLIVPNDQTDLDADQIGDACDDRDGRLPAICQQFAWAEFIAGTEGNDSLVGTPGRDVILGENGDDTIDGRGGADCIVAGPGRDLVRGRGGSDHLRGGRGRDVLNGGAGDDLCVSGSAANRNCER